MSKPDTSWYDQHETVVDAKPPKDAPAKADTSWYDGHEIANTPTAAAKAEPKGPASILESVARGAGDGVTFGFGDKVGLLDRAAQKKAQLDNPGSYLAGELLGLVPSLVAGPAGWFLRGGAAAAKAPTAARLIASGATQGGISGAGHADDGQMLEGAAKGTALGAFLPVAGAAGGLASRVTSALPIGGPIVRYAVEKPLEKILESGAFGAINHGVARSAPSTFERND